jgi:hypothetical protein
MGRRQRSETGNFWIDAFMEFAPEISTAPDHLCYRCRI